LYPDHKRRSKIQEKRTARDFGGITTPGSGNQWHSKADVKTPTELIECKTTTKASFTLKASDLKKIQDQALIEDRVPVFQVDFENDGVKCVVLSIYDYMRLRELWS